MRSFRIIIILAVLVMAFAVNADAVIITFTHQSAMSGHIGGTNFTNAPFIITAVGDTDMSASAFFALNPPHSSSESLLSGSPISRDPALLAGAVASIEVDTVSAASCILCRTLI